MPVEFVLAGGGLFPERLAQRRRKPVPVVGFRGEEGVGEGDKASNDVATILEELHGEALQLLGGLFAAIGQDLSDVALGLVGVEEEGVSEEVSLHAFLQIL